jgi:hypothetical protein
MEVEQDISLNEQSLHDFVKEQTNDGYDTALIGKWHLSNIISDPNSMGVGYFSGIIGGGVSSYTNWNRVTNGERGVATTYTTTDFSNHAIQWVSQRTKPWFLWLCGIITFVTSLSSPSVLSPSLLVFVRYQSPHDEPIDPAYDQKRQYQYR